MKDAGFSKIAKLACRFQLFCKESPINVVVTVDDIFRFLAEIKAELIWCQEYKNAPIYLGYVI